MGLPYSKEINSAFDQVTPLVAAAYEVLQTTKTITIGLLCIQVLTVVLLSLILFGILGLLFTLNPDLEQERQQLVTPVMQWLASWVYTYGAAASWVLRVALVLGTAGFGVFLWQGTMTGTRVPAAEEGGGDEGDKEEENKPEDQKETKE